MSDEAVVAQTGPYQVDLTEGQEYWYCRCGGRKRSRSATARMKARRSSR